jgi:ribosomal protein S18 acetylase RimI-like enzyme
MTDVPMGDLLSDAIRLALEGSHLHLAVRVGRAVRYPGLVAPFAAIDEPTVEAMGDLRSLLTPGETIFVMGARPPEVPGLVWSGIVRCLQMIFPEDAAMPKMPPGDRRITPLSCSDAPAMLELIAIAFPGYFREQTCRMGEYFGVWQDGRLIAMAGERLVLGPWREISGLCTYPEHAGRGLGTAMLVHVLMHQRLRGARSWLHVTTDNRRAIELYKHLGFEVRREVELHRLICDIDAS